MEVLSKNQIRLTYDALIEKSKEKFLSRNDFLKVYDIDGKYLTINLMDLTCADGDVLMPPEWWKVRKELFDVELEFRSTTQEFFALAYFLSYFPKLKFQKDECPDFILCNDEIKIGFEITTAYPKNSHYPLREKITRKFFGRGKKFDEIEKDINDDGRLRAALDESSIFDINGTMAILMGKPNSTSRDYLNDLVESVLIKTKKINKYQRFPLMALYIDTRDNVFFSNTTDANQLAQLFSENKNCLRVFDHIFVANRINQFMIAYNTKTTAHIIIHPKEENYWWM